MPTQLSGYEDNLSAKGSALRELTVSSVPGDKVALDTKHMTDFKIEVAAGRIPGLTLIHKFGEAHDFDASDGFVTVWDGADDATFGDAMQYTYSATADIDSVISTSASDTFEMEVQGLDGNYAKVTQNVTLTGTTRAALGTPLLRVFRMKNIGTSDNVGHVSCYVNTADTTPADGIPDDNTKIRAVMQPTMNQTLMAVYTVPAGCTVYLVGWYAGVSGALKSSQHNLRFVARPFGQVFQTKHVTTLYDSGDREHHEYRFPQKFDEKTDFEIRMNTDTGVASVSAGFDLICELN